jgi:hypothetical protein
MVISKATEANTPESNPITNSAPSDQLALGELTKLHNRLSIDNHPGLTINNTFLKKLSVIAY